MCDKCRRCGVWHGYHGDRSYKGLPAYGDQHGTAPSHSGVPVKHTRLHSGTGTPPRHSKVHPGTPTWHSKLRFQSMATYSSTTKLRHPTAFATSMVMTSPAREGLRGKLSQGAQRDAKHWYDKWMVDQLETPHIVFYCLKSSVDWKPYFKSWCIVSAWVFSWVVEVVEIK